MDGAGSETMDGETETGRGEEAETDSESGVGGKHLDSKLVDPVDYLEQELVLLGEVDKLRSLDVDVLLSFPYILVCV